MNMNKKQVIYQLNSIVNKIFDYKINSKLVPEFTTAEEYELKYAIMFLKDEANDKKNIDNIKQTYKEILKEEIQKNCDHTWGEEHWTWSCGGYRKCTKCGKIKEFYERD